MAAFINDLHFQSFVAELDKHIVDYGEPKDSEGFFKSQKKQVETLVKLEKRFKKILLNSPQGVRVYRLFIEHILENKRNILSARPYFRERQEVFTDNISDSIKLKNEKGLFRYNINYNFISFAVKACKFPDNGKIMKLFREIRDLRNKIAELNMPLAISRAKIFWSATPKSHLTYMDLVQISSEGLMAAIDKFVPPFTRVFRSVIIGRAVGNLISEYSETLVHFYPNDKRKIYRANKAIRHLGGAAEADFDVLATKVNEGLEDKIKTNSVEIRELLGAASTVSSDNSVGKEGEEIVHLTSKFPATDESRPDVISERLDLTNKLSMAISQLSIFEQKLLKLKGVHL